MTHPTTPSWRQPFAFCTSVLLFAASGAVLAVPMPESGTVTPAMPTTTFTGNFVVDNPAGACNANQQLRNRTCDFYDLALTLPADYASTNPSALLSIKVAGDNGADFDIEVRSGGTVLASGANGGDEEVEIPAGQGARALEIRIIPFLTTGGNYTTTIALATGAAGGGGGGDEEPDPTPVPNDAKAPRFYSYPPPAGVGSSSGEPSIGYNVITGKAMFLGGSDPTFKVTFPDHESLRQPQACDADWEDVTFAYTDGNIPPTLDPILFTDPGTGRTFVSQLLGASHRLAFTDDDGANWTPGIGTPNGATDHQTVGSGPYPAGTAIPHPASQIAVYYCSQQQYATCNRSDDGGLSFGAGVLAYNGLLDGCGNFHGHVKVAPDGTVYLPNAACGATQALAVSEDAGQSYTVRAVSGSIEAGGLFDPSVAIASDNTLYFCRSDGDGRVRVSVSKDRGVTWTNSRDIGFSQGVLNSAFPQAVAGDSDRASCAFLGSATPGNFQAADYAGVWHAYIATTYDGGNTWQTVNVTPNDPVQGAGGICISGTGCTGNNRNLLDFNEIALDEKGRPVFGFADGCTGACVNNPTTAANFAAQAAIVRQTGGKTLLSGFDSEVRSKPDGACLAGSRTSEASTLVWKAPADRGEAAVTTYNIYRGTTADSLSLIASNINRLSYVDPAGDSVSQYFYSVRANNSLGEGLDSNRVTLSIGAAPSIESTCKLPGLTVVIDPVADESGVNPSLDIRRVWVAEPENQEGNLIVTLKVGDLTMLPPNQLYAVRLKSPTAPAGAEDYWVGMNTAGGTARFVYGTSRTEGTPTLPAAGSAGVRVFDYVGDLPAASAYSVDGSIALVVPRNLVGNPQPGETLTGITASIRASSNAMAPTAGNAVDTTGDGTYVLRAVDGCFINTLPVAALVADVLTGNAPLTVAFDASGSSDADAGDRITSYSFGFGDGSEGLTQTAARAQHVYTEPGIYTAVVMVSDTHGGSSLASQRIEVLEAVQQEAAPFGFIERRDVPVNTFIHSETVTLSGFTGSLPIAVSEGLQYSINGGAFTNVEASVPAGATLSVRHVSASAEGATTEDSVTVGTRSTVFRSITTTVDRVPDAFSFGTKTEQMPGATVMSEPTILANFDEATIVAGPGIQYRIDSGVWTSTRGTLREGQVLTVQHTASNSSLGYTKTYLKVGGVTGYFTTRTKK